VHWPFRPATAHLRTTRYSFYPAAFFQVAREFPFSLKWGNDAKEVWIIETHFEGGG
jgi:hypothetical protein